VVLSKAIEAQTFILLEKLDCQRLRVVDVRHDDRVVAALQLRG
jgi:hypothetical protein